MPCCTANSLSCGFFMIFLQNKQRAEVRFVVSFSGVPSVRISKRTVFASLSRIGCAYTDRPFFFESQKDRTIGIRAPQAGFGHFTVLAHSQAITTALPPPCCSGSITPGYK